MRVRSIAFDPLPQSPPLPPVRMPKTCTGSWPVQVLVRYTDRQDVLQTPIACARA